MNWYEYYNTVQKLTDRVAHLEQRVRDLEAELIEARQFQMSLSNRILVAHEVIGKRAESNAKREPRIIPSEEEIQRTVQEQRLSL